MSMTVFLWLWGPCVILSLIVFFRVLDAYSDKRDRKGHRPAE